MPLLGAIPKWLLRSCAIWPATACRIAAATSGGLTGPVAKPKGLLR